MQGSVYLASVPAADIQAGAGNRLDDHSQASRHRHARHVRAIRLGAGLSFDVALRWAM